MADDQTQVDDTSIMQAALAQPDRSQPQQFTPEEIERFPFLAPKPAPTPAAQPKEPSPEDKSFNAVLSDALAKTEWSQPFGPAGRLQQAEFIGKRIATDVASGAAWLSQAGAQALATGEAPDLQGMSVDQVKATRAQMQGQLEDSNKLLDIMMQRGDPDNPGMLAAANRAASLEGRIKQADDIIAKGAPATVPSPVTGPVTNALRNFGRQATPAVSDFLNRVFPTNLDYKNSVVGQIDQFGADGMAMIGSDVVLGPLGAVGAAASIMGDQTYQEAKKAGADDQTAERASLMVGLFSGAAMPVLGSGINAFARGMAGLSAKQGMVAISKALPFAIRTAGGGAEFGAFSLWQDKVAKDLAGYDPNRQMGATFWQNFLTGSVFGAWHGFSAEDPRISSMSGKNGTKVRERQPQPPPPPPLEGQQPPPPPPPTGPKTPPGDQTGEVVHTAETAADIPVVKQDNRTTHEKLDDWTPELSEEEQQREREAAATPVTQKTTEQAAHDLSVAAPSTQTLEKQGETPVSGTTTTTAPTVPEAEAAKTPTPATTTTAQVTEPPVVARQAPEAAPAQQGTPLTDGSPQHRLAMKQLVAGGMPEAEARQRIAQTPSTVQGGGRWRDVVQQIAGNIAQSEASQRQPEEVAPVAPTVTPVAAAPKAKRPTGYRVSWMDYEPVGGDAKNGLYREETFRTKKEAQAHLQYLKQRNVLQVKTENLFEPKAWYENWPQQQRELQGYTQQELTNARDAVAQGYRDEGRNPDEVVNSEWVADMKRRLEDSRQAPAARIVLRREMPPDRPVTPDDVKAETIKAQGDMGMYDNLVHTPTVDDLPQHVLEGMTPQQRANAQVVTDRKLGNVHIIGDRFSTLQELQRAIIEETLPYRYRNVTELMMKHDPNDDRLGTYDHIGDRPVLNTHALLRTANPYREASRSAMEEVDVHNGISRLLGPKEGRRYVQGMQDIRDQFNRLGWNDMLAQQKGFKDVDEMAAAYGIPDYKTDPKQANKMTEELIGAFSRTFGSPEELTAKAPAWYMLALRNIGNGIRRFLGMRVDPYDVQSLINDSAAALRTPKWAQPSLFHPIGDDAKAEMQQFQYANRMPVEGEPGTAGPTERADIGTEIVKQFVKRLQAGLSPDEFIRAQPLKMAMDQTRSLDDRLALLQRAHVIDSYLSHSELMQQAQRIYYEDFNGDANQAIEGLIHAGVEGPVSPAITEVVSRKGAEEVAALRAEGNEGLARLMQARLDRMEQLNAPQVTGVARELSAQRLRHLQGNSLVAEHRQDIQDAQKDETDRLPKQTRDRITQAQKDIETVTKASADNLINDPTVKRALDRLKKTTQLRWRGTKPLGAQYSDDLVARLKDAIFGVAGQEGRPDRPAMQQLYDTFKKQIQQVINEAVPQAQPLRKPPNPMDTLRSVMENYPYYKEAWARTVEMLKAQEPPLDPNKPELSPYHMLDSALDEPVGEKLANSLAMAHGQDLNDLIYNHYTTADRLNQDLALQITQNTGLSGTSARQLTNHLQGLFRDIIDGKQRDRLQSILDSVGGTKPKDPKGQLDALVDHIAIGGLDSPEWLNQVAPRFGISSYTPAHLELLRTAGDQMMKIRDQGLENTVVAQKFRQDIGDIMRMNGQTQFDRGLRYVMDVYTAGILNGPFTHIPYWQQIGVNQLWDAMLQGARMLRHAPNTDEAVKAAMTMVGRLGSGYARGYHEFAPILRRGIKPEEEFLPQQGGRPLYRGRLDVVDPELAKPWTWWSNYRYVRDFLDAVSNFMTRGPQYAIHHALEMENVWSHGMTGEDAASTARSAVLGDDAQQNRATSNAARFQQDFNLNDSQRKVLEGQLLDMYKTGADTPEGSLPDTEASQAIDRAKRAMDASVSGTLRGDVKGALGAIGRGAMDFTNKNPILKPIMPFIKVPLNAINQFMAWSPIGITRSIRDLLPEQAGQRYQQIVPEMFGGKGIRSYLGGARDMAYKLEHGQISEDSIRDEAWRQMSRGIIGTSALGTLGLLIHSNMQQDNPWFRLTYNGPPDFGKQEIERQKGWQEKSMYIGGAWHSYENTPLRPVLAFLGAYEDYVRYEHGLDQPLTAWDEANAATHGVGAGLASLFGTPLQGLEAMLNFLSDAGSGFSAGGAQRSVSNFATAIAGSVATELIPSPVGTGTMARQVYRLFDPTQYEAADGWGKFARYIPVVNAHNLEAKLNVFGQPMQSSPLKSFPEYTPTGGLFGWQPVVKADDPVWNYLEKHPRISLSMPGNNASVGKYKMTPEEIYLYHQTRGPELYRMMQEHVVDNAHFASMNPQQQNRAIRVYEHEANLRGAKAIQQYRLSHPPQAEMLKKGMQQLPAVETAGTEGMEPAQ